MKNFIYVTTSWDDGHKLDLRIMKLLKKYNLKGTFYISPKNRQFPKADLLTAKEVISLSKNFEIGAHTMTHPLLPDDFPTTFYKVVTKIFKLLHGESYAITPNISVEEAEKEIVNSKKYLEKLLGKKVVAFCYPAGRYNKAIVNLVKKSGFKYARIVKDFETSKASNSFTSPTTLHAAWAYSSVIKIANFSRWNLNEILKNLDWETLAKRKFDSLQPGDIYHLWGHSWIIDKNKDWEKLEKVFRYIANRKNVKYVENKDLVSV